MQDDPNDSQTISPGEHNRLATTVMRRQAKLSVCVAIVFMLLLIGLPLFNLYAPTIANMTVLGFSATWLLLGILFFPITWLLSAIFVRESNRIEGESARWRSEVSEYVRINTEEDSQ